MKRTNQLSNFEHSRAAGNENQYYVVMISIGEIITTNLLKWVVWRLNLRWGLHRLGFRHTVALCTLLTFLRDVGRDVWPEHRVSGAGTHGTDTLVC